jgi:hypothetical protein
VLDIATVVDRSHASVETLPRGSRIKGTVLVATYRLPWLHDDNYTFLVDARVRHQGRVPESC